MMDGDDGDGDFSFHFLHCLLLLKKILSTFTPQVVSGEPQPASICHLLPNFPLGSPRQPTSNAIVVKVMM